MRIVARLLSANTHLDRSLDALERMRSECVRRRSLDELQVAQCRKLDREVLQRLVCLIDDEHVEENIKLVNVDVGFGVNGIRETRELNDAIELRDEVVFRRLD